MDILTEVKQELANRKGTWPKIAEETGLAYGYIAFVAQGRIKDPGVKKLERLRAYFRKNKTAA